MAKASNFPCDLEGGQAYLRSLSAPTAQYETQPGMEGVVFVYNGMNLRGRVHVDTDFSDSIQVRLVVGLVVSSESGFFSAIGGVWSPEINLTGVSATGWQSIEWQVNWYARPSGTITVRGHNVNQVEV